MADYAAALDQGVALLQRVQGQDIGLGQGQVRDADPGRHPGPVGQARPYGNVEGFRSLQRNTFRQDAVGTQAEVGVLLGAAQRQDTPIIML